MARATSRTIIVPGHGAPTSRTELAGYRDMLVAVGRRVREAVERGENLQQVLAAHPTAEFDAHFTRSDAPASAEDFVREVLMDALDGEHLREAARAFLHREEDLRHAARGDLEAQPIGPDEFVDRRLLRERPRSHDVRGRVHGIPTIGGPNAV